MRLSRALWQYAERKLNRNQRKNYYLRTQDGWKVGAGGLEICVRHNKRGGWNIRGVEKGLIGYLST